MRYNQPIAKIVWQADNGYRELNISPQDMVTIGRGDSNTIVLNSAKVSRNHARIEWGGDSFTVRDLGSSNGTFVNGQRVEHTPRVLKDGDLILLEREPIHFEEIELSREEQGLSTHPTSHMQREMSSMEPRLIIIEGPENGREILIDEHEITIGRDCDSATWNMRLKDGTVSRPHARIDYQQGLYSLIDLGSANGTTLNGSLIIASAILNDGDIIGIGVTKLVFRAKS